MDDSNDEDDDNVRDDDDNDDDIDDDEDDGVDVDQVYDDDDDGAVECIDVGIELFFSKFMSVTIHGLFSLESGSGVRFWEVSDIFGPKKSN